jgi:hypothetical protein
MKGLSQVILVVALTSHPKMSKNPPVMHRKPLTMPGSWLAEEEGFFARGQALHRKPVMMHQNCSIGADFHRDGSVCDLRGRASDRPL